MLAINYNLFKSVMSAKTLRVFYAPTRTVLISVVVLTLTGSPSCAQDEAELEAVSQSPDATVMPNDAAVTDLPVAVDANTSNDENATLSVEEMRAKANNVDADIALPENPDDAFPADTDAAASRGGGETESATQEDGVITGIESESTIQTDESVDEETVESVTITPEDGNAADERNVSSEENTESVLGTTSPADTEASARSGVEIDSTTQIEEKNAKIAGEDEESMASASTTTTTADGNAADEQDVITKENRETIPNTTSAGNAVFTQENSALSATDTGTNGEYATKEQLNYVSNLVVDLQREIKSVKNSSVPENRFTEIKAAMDAIRKDLDELRGGKNKPGALPQVTSEEEETDDEKTALEEVEEPEEVPPPPFQLVQNIDGTPHLQRKGQVAELHLQELADDGRCQEIGDWIKQTGIKLEKRVVFVQKNNRVAKCKQINSGKWKVYSSSASDTGYVVLPNGE